MQLVICLTKEKINEKSMSYYVRNHSESSKWLTLKDWNQDLTNIQ